MKKTFLSKLLPIFSLTLFLTLTSTLTSAEVVGTFSRVEGRVDILKVGETSAVPLKGDDSVSMGDIIRTKSDGKAEIIFKDESIIRIAPETRIEINEYILRQDNSRSSSILKLLRGKVRAIVSKAKSGIIPAASGDSSFNIQTKIAVAGVRGTDFFVFHDRGITGVIFKEGSGFVTNPSMPEKIVNINAGQVTFVVSPNIPPSPPRPATSMEMASHTKDTTPAEKPKEEKKEDKPKEEKAKEVEAKAEKKEEGKKEEGKPTEEAKKEEGVKEEKPKEEGVPVKEEKPAGEKPATTEVVKTEEGKPETAEAPSAAPTAEKPAVAESAPAIVNIPDVKTLKVADITPAVDIGGMITPAAMITSPIPIGGDLGLTGAAAADAVSIPTAITTAVSGTTVDTSSVNTVSLLPVTETHPNLLTDVTINLKFP